jgi:hypothetical protein
MQNSIKAALAFHSAHMADHHHEILVFGNAALEDARVSNALLKRLKTSTLFDDDDDGKNTPEEAARNDLIRRRKTRCLIERKKQDSEAKDSITAPSDPLPLNHRLSNHHDFLAVHIFLMDLEAMVARKDWGSPIEMWVFKQFEKGSKAHTAFRVYLKSGQGVQLYRNLKCYSRDFVHFNEVILRLFITKLSDPIAVIEKNLKRIKLTLTGTDGPTTPTNLEGFCNTLRFLVNQAPAKAAYPERQQVSRIHERLPKKVETYLLEWEVNNAEVINIYDVLMACLHWQDVLFSDSQESKLPPTSSNKRLATEVAIQVAEVIGGHKKGRKVDNRHLCSFCSTPGHLIDACWLKHLEKKKAFHTRGRGPPGAVLPLNNITTSSLQAMISHAVDNVLASANKP